MPTQQQSALMWGALVQQPPLALFSILVIAWLAQVDDLCDWLLSTVCVSKHTFSSIFTSVWCNAPSPHPVILSFEMSCILVSICMRRDICELLHPFHLNPVASQYMFTVHVRFKRNYWLIGKKNLFFAIYLKGLVVICSSTICEIVSDFIPSFSHPALHLDLFLIYHYLLCLSGAFGGFGTTTTTAAPAGSTFSFAAPSSTTGQ